MLEEDKEQTTAELPESPVYGCLAGKCKEFTILPLLLEAKASYPTVLPAAELLPKAPRRGAGTDGNGCRGRS